MTPRLNRKATRVARWVAAGALTTLVTSTGLPAAAQSGRAGPDIRGGWRADTYTLKTGERHQVTGLIVFTATDWGVTFFVTPEGKAPVRASSEGGTYTLEGTSLALIHQYNFSTGSAVPGLPASPLRMTIQGEATGTVERITVSVNGDRLTLAFPSGNAMTFQRSSRF
ncbi:MAG: hypothetical protein ACT4QD_20190 [Acidobacteriota bacterium]